MSDINTNGFGVVEDVFDSKEIFSILKCIENTQEISHANFRKSEDLFAIRQFVKTIPEIIPLVFTPNFKKLVQEFTGNDFFLVKSIYFDKPPSSNWFVSYHQDLTISVDKKVDLPGYGPWTIKHQQFAVQPPLEILENIVTFRIHLDDTNHENGALKVVPFSHVKQIYRPETIDWTVETEVICPVNSGGVMLMKPLLLHGSNRTTNERRRRVIHLEFSNKNLATGLNWAEKLEIL